MKTPRFLPLSLIAAAVLSACTTMPAADSPLVRARNDFSAAQASPQVTSLAAGELRQASDSLDKANAASSKGESAPVVDHLAYVTTQHVAIARETAAQKAAELAVANAGAERDRMRLEARTREADAATRNAQDAQRQAEAAQRMAAGSRRDAEASQRSAAVSQQNADASLRQAAAERQAANDELASAQAARELAQDAENRTRQVEAQLVELQARKTDRGMVITLGDVLFDTNQAQLKSGSMRDVQKLADFFKRYPQRRAAIEGFTDSTGGDLRNQELSEKRADSVRVALLGMGVANERITARGYGEAYPAAANDTAAGRQMNRRVEIIVSDDGGRIAPRT